MRTTYYLILLSSIVTTIHALAAPKQHAVVVGGGPVGIAAALTLAKHHNYSVTLLESQPASSAQTKYDPSKSIIMRYIMIFILCILVFGYAIYGMIDWYVCILYVFWI